MMSAHASEVRQTSGADAMEQRKHEEAAFHDQRERDRHVLSDEEYQRKYSNRKWYAITTRSSSFLRGWLRDNVAGKTVLDYCCGLGGTSLRLAQAGAHVHAIDISSESVETAQRLAREAGLDDRIKVQVMDAENMVFEDGMFDVAVCLGVLHHLDVSKAFPELCRVLKPEGRVIAQEALGYNPAIALYRRLTPKLRTGWEKDHILTHRELAVAGRSFSSVTVRYFHLFAILATPFRRTRVFGPILAVLNAVDDIVLRIPGVRRMAWQMIVVIGDPRKAR